MVGAWRARGHTPMPGAERCPVLCYRVATDPVNQVALIPVGRHFLMP